jgi:uncharacterized protein YhaN
VELTAEGRPAGIAHRIAELYEAKVNALLDWAEDPGEMLDYSSRQQQEFLHRMRSTVADMTASRNRAWAQEQELRRAADRLRADEGRLAEEAALKARAEALSEQIKVDEPAGPPSGDFYQIQEELDALARDAAVEEELARIRVQLTPQAKKRSSRKAGGT